MTVVYIPDFSIGATVLLSRFEKNLFSITVGLTNKDVEVFNEFAMRLSSGPLAGRLSRPMLRKPPTLAEKGSVELEGM
jgi:hypothetical protein